MKHSISKILGLGVFVVFSGVAFPATAASGAYVCKAAETPGGDDTDARNVARVLNSLSCDTTKPVTTMADNKDDTSIIVCCVQK